MERSFDPDLEEVQSQLLRMGAEVVDMVALVMSALVERDSPERAFVEKTLGAILVLLGFLVLMNLEAVVRGAAPSDAGNQPTGHL